jgi:sulfur-oxidizing protein SoxY
MVASLTRRTTLIGSLATGSALALPAAAETSNLERELAALTGGRPAQAGRVALTLPSLAENGNVVALSVAVDSPMTDADHVRTITILSEKNPVTHIATFHLGPRAGRARIATNIRLSTTQRVLAVAAMSDGSFWTGEQSVVVTLAACVNGG